jgi:hypothetical protein
LIKEIVENSGVAQESTMKMKTAISILAVGQVLSPTFAAPHRLDLLHETAKPQAPTSAAVPNCRVTGASELTITCSYTAGWAVDPDARPVPRIILNRAVISLIPSDGNPMRVELTFTNGMPRKIAGRRTVYLSIDDEKGQNHMRRPLPHVDFTKLEPGRLTRFQETLLAPAFSPGTYIVSIWIPSIDPSLKFDPKHNLLLSSKGVPNRTTGLNRVAEFAVTSSGGSASNENQTEPR